MTLTWICHLILKGKHRKFLFEIRFHRDERGWTNSNEPSITRPLIEQLTLNTTLVSFTSVTLPKATIDDGSNFDRKLRWEFSEGPRQTIDVSLNPINKPKTNSWNNIFVSFQTLRNRNRNRSFDVFTQRKDVVRSKEKNYPNIEGITLDQLNHEKRFYVYLLWLDDVEFSMFYGEWEKHLALVNLHDATRRRSKQTQNNQSQQVKLSIFFVSFSTFATRTSSFIIENASITFKKSENDVFTSLSSEFNVKISFHNDRQMSFDDPNQRLMI